MNEHTEHSTAQHMYLVNILYIAKEYCRHYWGCFRCCCCLFFFRRLLQTHQKICCVPKLSCQFGICSQYKHAANQRNNSSSKNNCFNQIESDWKIKEWNETKRNDLILHTNGCYLLCMNIQCNMLLVQREWLSECVSGVKIFITFHIYSAAVIINTEFT